ncbi:MAG: thiol oxidoreductase [Maribacter sp.]|nr:thiol oxidoreductase [Maribacter sp.]
MKKSPTYFLSFTLILISILVACDKFEPMGPEESELLDGPIEGLSNSESKQFLDGDIAFNDDVFTSQNGLGPTFVATSCGSCHAGDGKGHPFTTLTRFGQSAPGTNMFLKQGGPQQQNRALPGFEPEQIPEGATFSKLTPPANTGLGFLELVSDADLLDIADPNDTDGDGISGIPNWIEPPLYIIPTVNAIVQNGKYIHRFGKKAAAYNLMHQTVNAYNQDIGITSVFAPIDVFSGLEVEPEVDINTINDVVFYLQTLKAPIPRNQNDAEVIQGKNIFNQINCTGCHRPSLKTGYSSIAVLSNMQFNPYTDLLLHDMGSGLDDGYTEGNAETYEWRTPPLWGLGLSPNSQGGEYFLLHDGRAKSIEEAILLHGGEASRSKTQYDNLEQADQSALLKFLESL